MSDYDAIECTLCGYYYMRHHGTCPNCYPEQVSNTTGGEYVAIAYPNKLDSAVKAVEKAQKGAKESSSLERAFMTAWALTGLEMPVTEYRFCMTRRWRADFAWPDILLLVEMEGGLWGNGRHNRAGGYIADLEKYNYAAELGYTVLRYHKVDGDMLNQIERVYKRLLAEKAK